MLDVALLPPLIFAHCTTSSIESQIDFSVLSIRSDERVGVEADGDAVAGDLSQRGDVFLEGRKGGLLVGGVVVFYGSRSILTLLLSRAKLQWRATWSIVLENRSVNP